MTSFEGSLNRLTKNAGWFTFVCNQYGRLRIVGIAEF